MKKIVALLKFSKEKVYQQDIVKGKLYCNSGQYLRFFSNDNHDNIYSKVSLSSDFNVIIGSRPHSLFPICCFYAVYEEDLIGGKIDSRKINLTILKKEFGEYVTIICGVKQFLEKLKTFTYEFNYGLVKYEVTNDNYGTYVKRPKYSYEQEFRLCSSKIVIDGVNENHFDKISNSNELIKSFNMDFYCSCEKEEILEEYRKDFHIAKNYFIINLGNLSDLTIQTHINSLLDVQFNYSEESTLLEPNFYEYEKNSWFDTGI